MLTTKKAELISILRNVKWIAFALALGIDSGIVFALLVSTSKAYLVDNHFSLELIGLSSLIVMPYSLKYLWSSSVDYFSIRIFPPTFGQRKGWIVLMQICLFLLIPMIGLIDLKSHKMMLFVLLLVIAIFGATHDVAMQAYRIEVFGANKQGRANSLVIFGFRVGFIISNIFALYLSTIIEWKWVFYVIALFMLPSTIVIWCSTDNKVANKQKHKDIKTLLWYNVIYPLILLKKVRNIGFIIIFIAFYKVSDTYIDSMQIAFFINVGFTKTQIAMIAKVVGTASAILGTFAGGLLIDRCRIELCLFMAEILAATSNLLFIIFLYVGVSLPALVTVNMVENICYGISNVVLITYMGTLCNRKFTATHFALMECIAITSRTILASTSGFVSAYYGWFIFFIISALLSIPSLLCIYKISQEGPLHKKQ